jgi:hypothetical protein
VKPRQIRCPEDKDGVRYSAVCTTTGEALESTDLAALFRRIAADIDVSNHNWALFPVGVKPVEPKVISQYDIVEQSAHLTIGGTTYRVTGWDVKVGGYVVVEEKYP